MTAMNIGFDNSLEKDTIPFEIKRMKPNAETCATITEYIDMKDKTKYKRYENFDDVIEEVLNDISVPQKQNEEVISEDEYNDIIKAKRNVEYLAMLDRAMSEVETGKFILKSIDELGEYE